MFNKCDLLDEVSQQRLVAGRDDVVALSALRRNTTHTLLQLIADKLADRWARSALRPETATLD